MGPQAFLPNLGIYELFVVVIALTGIIISIFSVVDAARRRDKQWDAIGVNKGLWIILMALGAWLCFPVGLIAAIYYVAVLRPRLESAGIPPSF